MCNIAAYVGDRPAAPILIEMIRRQEGLNGGFFTGIATIHEGRIHYRKLTGDLQHLLDNTDAASLPGNIGLIHSRTNDGGGDKWSHPFVSGDENDPHIAYVANGGSGIFKERRHEYGLLAEKLHAEGYTLHSKQFLGEHKYNPLSDGSAVHMSDAMCQLIAKHIDMGKTEDRAMADAFCQMPSEIVGLLISLAHPDRIFFSRISMPMFVGFSDHGAYMASSPTAFFDDAGEPTLLPANSSGWVAKRSFFASPYDMPPAAVAPIDASLRRDAYELITEALSKESLTVPKLAKLIESRFKSADCYPRAAAVYEVLYALNKEGRLTYDAVTVDGSYPPLTAPRFNLRLK